MHTHSPVQVLCTPSKGKLHSLGLGAAGDPQPSPAGVRAPTLTSPPSGSASEKPSPDSKAAAVAGASRGPGISAAASREHARDKKPSKCMVEGPGAGEAGPVAGAGWRARA